MEQPPDYAALWQGIRPELTMRSGSAAADAAVCYLFAQIRQVAGKRWLQGVREPALAWRLPNDTEQENWQTEAWTTLATRHVYRVEAHVAALLAKWRRGFADVRLTERAPTPTQMLEAQAQGFRWLSLLPPGADCGHEASPLEFALHDLCHAAHYFDPAHHVEQRGFFSAVLVATRSPNWPVWAGQFGADFVPEFHRVAADMNGSACFLWAALRKKVAIAAALNRLDARAAQLELAAMMRMPPDVTDSALRFSVHRDADPEETSIHAATILTWLRGVGC